MSIFFNSAFSGIEKTIEAIDSITDNLKFNVIRDDLHFYILSVVHAVGDIYPRIKGTDNWNSLPDEDKHFILAFAYLNNQLKHDKGLNVIYFEVSGSMFPVHFPMRFGPPGVYWVDFEDHGQSKEAKRAYYDTYLNDKDVKVTLLKLRKILHSIDDNT